VLPHKPVTKSAGNCRFLCFKRIAQLPAGNPSLFHHEQSKWNAMAVILARQFATTEFTAKSS
jgi:hypothetical protein